jgi:hypothetical protein
VSYHVDHTHRLILLRDRVFSGYSAIDYPVTDGQLLTLFNFRTTFDNNHSHLVYLTTDNITALRAGQTITKKTSSNARPGGSQHSHTVTISCLSKETFRAQSVY